MKQTSTTNVSSISGELEYSSDSDQNNSYGEESTFDIENIETTPNISEAFSDQTKPPLRSWKRLLRNSRSSKVFEISNSTPVTTKRQSSDADRPSLS